MKYIEVNPFPMQAMYLKLNDVLEAACALWSRTRKGFCFAIVEQANTSPVLIGRLGKIRNSKISKYFTFVAEKAERLLKHNLHTTSYKSREPEHKKYGGAVRGTNHILSISGFAKEHEDEAVAMVTLVLCGEKEETVAFVTAERTGNKLFSPLLAACRRQHGGG